MWDRALEYFPLDPLCVAIRPAERFQSSTFVRHPEDDVGFSGGAVCKANRRIENGLDHLGVWVSAATLSGRYPGGVFFEVKRRGFERIASGSRSDRVQRVGHFLREGAHHGNRVARVVVELLKQLANNFGLPGMLAYSVGAVQSLVCSCSELFCVVLGGSDPGSTNQSMTARASEHRKQCHTVGAGWVPGWCALMPRVCADRRERGRAPTGVMPNRGWLDCPACRTPPPPAQRSARVLPTARPSGWDSSRSVWRSGC